MNWFEYRLDEIGTVSRGRSRHRPRDAKHLYGGPYPFVQTGDIKHAGLYLSEYSQTYSEAGLAQSKLWPVGTLCITIAANIAETAILDIEACFPDSVIGFIPDEKKSDAKFVKYMFDALLKKRFQAFAQGATQDNLSQGKLLSLTFPVPDLHHQKWITSILSTYDNLIENNQRRIALLEEAAQQLYKEWFVRFRYPGHEHVPIIDGVPEGWEYCRLIDLAEITMGQSPKSEFYNNDGNGLPFHQGVTNFGFRFVSHKTYCTKPTRLSQAGDILFSVRAPVGRINMCDDQIVLGRGLSAMRSRTGHQSFLFYQLKSFFFKENMVGGGAIYAAVNKKQLENSELLCPSSNMIEQFNDFASSIDWQIKILTQSIAQLAKARDLLLPKLMNGEIAV